MKPRLSFKNLLKTLISGVLVVAFTTSPASALTDAEWNMFDVNGIYYWNPSGSDFCTIGTGSYDGTTSAGLSSVNANFIDTYHDIAAQLSVEYGIPWETVIAQGILESNSGRSNFARNRNNFFGIGAVDSNPDAAYSYETPEAGWRGYFNFIATNSRYRNHGVFQNNYTVTHTIKPNGLDKTIRNNITNPYDYLQTIWDAGYATDPGYYQKIAPIITGIINRAQEKGWATSDQLATEHPEMIANAGSYASGSSPSAGNNNQSYTGTACITVSGGSGSGNGSINQTALDLAWPLRGAHTKEDPKPEYKEALAFIGAPSSSDTYYRYGASCDAFAAAVMRYSGVDPHFPLYLGGATGQLSYLQSHPNLYQYIGQASDTSQVQPGDIRVNGSHIEIVVQRGDGLGIASASHGERTAEAFGYYNDSSYAIYRHL